ncbi:aspartate 1-decarboxylase [bacterium]|nr:aspartate 1-decarboxylase [bacterium]
MLVHICKAKIHRATVNDLDLNYEGSITIDRDLMDATNILPFEKVQVLNINNGERAETYVIEGERGSGIIGLNGALARLAQKGDLLIIIAYALMEETEAKKFHPIIVHVDQNNHITKIQS